VILLLLIMWLFSTGLDTALDHPITITPRMVLSADQLAGFPSGLQIDSKGTVFVLMPRDKRIEALAPGKAEPHLIARDGQGPDEIDGGFFSASIVDDQLVVLGINRNVLKTVFPDPDKKLGTTYFALKDFVRAGKNHVLSINVRPGESIYTSDGEISSPDVALIRFRTASDGWVPDGYFLEREIMPDPVANTYAALRTKLLEHPEPEQVYNIPGWGSPTFRVIDKDGNLGAEYPIPHPLSERMPRDPELRFALFRDHRDRGRMLAGATIDRRGTLYFLLDGLVRRIGGESVSFSRHLIVAHHPQKSTYRVFRSETPLRGLLHDLERGIYSLDGEGNLRHFTIPD